MELITSRYIKLRPFKKANSKPVHSKYLSKTLWLGHPSWRSWFPTPHTAVVSCQIRSMKQSQEERRAPLDLQMRQRPRNGKTENGGQSSLEREAGERDKKGRIKVLLCGFLLGLRSASGLGFDGAPPTHWFFLLSLSHWRGDHEDEEERVEGTFGWMGAEGKSTFSIIRKVQKTIIGFLVLTH